MEVQLEFKNIPKERRFGGKRRSPWTLFITFHGIVKKEIQSGKGNRKRKRRKKSGERGMGEEKSFPRRINSPDFWPLPCTSARFYPTASFQKRMNLEEMWHFPTNGNNKLLCGQKFCLLFGLNLRLLFTDDQCRNISRSYNDRKTSNMRTTRYSPELFAKLVTVISVTYYPLHAYNIKRFVSL